MAVRLSGRGPFRTGRRGGCLARNEASRGLGRPGRPGSLRAPAPARASPAARRRAAGPGGIPWSVASATRGRSPPVRSPERGARPPHDAGRPGRRAAVRHSPWSARRRGSLSDRTCILMTGSSHRARTCVLIESCHRLRVPRHCGQPVVFRRRRPGRRAAGAVPARARRGPRRPRDRRQLAGADILGAPAAGCLADSSFWSGQDPDTHAFDRPHARGEG
jgi:hypothetical protein